MIDELEYLAERARIRRMSLRLTIKAVANEMDIQYGVLRRWEQRLNRKPKSQQEAKWEKALQVPEGWLRDNSIESDDVKITNGVDLSHCTTVLDEIHSICNWLSVSNIYARTTQYTALSKIEARNSDILRSRVGCNGYENTTLEAIGQPLSLTRERVRQITDKMIERTSDLKVVNTPHIDDLLAQIIQELPSTKDKVNNQFSHLLGNRLSCVDFGAFCNEILGKKSFYVTSIYSGPPGRRSIVTWLDTSSDSLIEEELRAVRKASISMISNLGAAHLSLVCGEANRLLKNPISYARTKMLVKSNNTFEWLSEDMGWFWYGPLDPRRSRLINSVRKVLSTSTEHIDSNTLYHGFLRTRRHISQDCERRRVFIELPSDIFSEVLRRHPTILMKQYDDFQLKECLNPDVVLSGLENAILNVIVAAGGVTSRKRLLSVLCKDGDITVTTLQSVLDKSSIFSYLEAGLYKLRGAQLDLDVLTIALNERELGMPGDRVCMPENSDGDIVFSVKAGVVTVRDRTVVMPAAAARAVDNGSYEVLDEMRVVPLETVTSGATYIRKVLDNYAGEITIGDHITVTINSQRRTVSYLISKSPTQIS